MISFEKAEALYATVNTWPERSMDHNFSLASDLRFVTSVWSNYSKLIPAGETIPPVFSKKFSNDADCRSYKMLGQFKNLEAQLSEITRKAIYELWVDRFERDCNSGWSYSQSLLEAAVFQVQKVQKIYYNRELSSDRIATCLALIFYNTTKGMAEEIRINRGLTKKYADNEVYRYMAAPDSEEKNGVDAIIYLRSTGEIYKKISIKCFGALSMSSLKRSRETFGKTQPDLYIGYAQEGDKKLTQIHASEVDG